MHYGRYLLSLAIFRSHHHHSLGGGASNEASLDYGVEWNVNRKALHLQSMLREWQGAKTAEEGNKNK